jgi:hypothetical protein
VSVAAMMVVRLLTPWPPPGSDSVDALAHLERKKGAPAPWTPEDDLALTHPNDEDDEDDSLASFDLKYGAFLV